MTRRNTQKVSTFFKMTRAMSGEQERPVFQTSCAGRELQGVNINIRTDPVATLVPKLPKIQNMTSAHFRNPTAANECVHFSIFGHF